MMNKYILNQTAQQIAWPEVEYFQFDALCSGSQSLGEEIGVSPEAVFAKPKLKKFFDDLSDDEEYQNMSQEERDEKMRPKMNTGNLFRIKTLTRRI